MEDGLNLKIFRHMKIEKKRKTSTGAIFIVRFKFNKFSHEANMRTSMISIPLIAGFPGFRDKLWMIDWETGYWQGIYQWDNTAAIKKYQKSFVFGIINKRSVENSISYKVIPNLNIDEFLRGIVVD
jgi:hypothetical protein